MLLRLSFCLSVLLVLSPASWGQLREQSAAPTAFGRDYYYTDEVQRVLAQAERAPLGQPGLSATAEVEWRAGPYHPRLAEFLLQQAGYLQERGDYDAAIQHLRRAVHVTRVNLGLHSQQQIPLLQRLNLNYLETGELELADNNQTYLHFLQQRVYPEWSPERIEASLEFIDWQRQAWLLDLGKQAPKRLFNAWRLLQQMWGDSASREKLPLASLERLSEARMRWRYLVEQIQFETRDFYWPGRDRSLFNDPETSLSAEEQKWRNLQRSAYSNGRRDLEYLLQRQQAAGRSAAAAATRIELGDWHLWHNHWSQAVRDYRAAWRELSAGENAALRRSWLESPRELPASDVYFAPLALREEGAEQTELLARFQVNVRGRAQQIRLEAASAPGQAYSHRLSRWLRRARFRPAMADGDLLNAAPMQRHYTVMR